MENGGVFPVVSCNKYNEVTVKLAETDRSVFSKHCNLIKNVKQPGECLMKKFKNVEFW